MIRCNDFESVAPDIHLFDLLRSLLFDDSIQSASNTRPLTNTHVRVKVDMKLLREPIVWSLVLENRLNRLRLFISLATGFDIAGL